METHFCVEGAFSLLIKYDQCPICMSIRELFWVQVSKVSCQKPMKIWVVFSLCTLELCGTAVTCAVLSVRAASIAVSPEEILCVWHIMHNALMWMLCPAVFKMLCKYLTRNGQCWLTFRLCWALHVKTVKLWWPLVSRCVCLCMIEIKG